VRTSLFPLQTQKEIPSEAEITSHQLMLRAGMIRRLASGLYTWLPLGLRVLRKVENIVREEMTKVNALEVLMPAVQPAELWQESGRWDQYGPELLRFTDRHNREFCFGPTHEEIITDLARNTLNSYKQLPITYYQIQTKFRDEIRPRFGIMRSREFIMKDAYSFHQNQESLEQTYDVMFAAYQAIFNRCGLDFRPVQADTGSIGGNASHEFHVITDAGEDAIAFSTDSDYAANVELAEATCADTTLAEATLELTTVETPNAKTIEELVNQFDIKIVKTVKTLIVKASEESEADFVALLVRGDHQLNELKAEKLSAITNPLQFATETEIRDAIGAGPGSLGPIGLSMPIIIDRSVAMMSDFSAGANKDGFHHFGINWKRDLPTPEIADIRNVQEGDPSPDGKGTITLARGVEVGHIFQLGTKYSEALKATVLDENGKAAIMTMGCYGIGVSRVVAAAIEQKHDDLGIVWPKNMAPFEVALLPMNYKKSETVRAAIEKLYDELTAAGIDVLLDDRDVRAGAMFKDCELIGIPHRVVIGDRSLKVGEVEYRNRTADDNEMIALDGIVDFLKEALK